MRQFTLLLLFFLILTPCQASAEMHLRSGTQSDPYIEEPFIPEVKEYEAYLPLSNTYVEKLDQGDYAYLVDDFDESVGNVSPDQLEDMHQGIVDYFGSMREYKKGQWWFIEAVENDMPILVSRKVILHEGGLVAYDFVFLPDDKERKLAGFYMKEMIP